MDEEERRAYTNSCMHFFKFNADTLAPIFDDLTPRARGEALNAVYGLALYGEEPGHISKAARSAYMCARPNVLKARANASLKADPSRPDTRPGTGAGAVSRRQLAADSTAATRAVLREHEASTHGSTQRVQAEHSTSTGGSTRTSTQSGKRQPTGETPGVPPDIPPDVPPDTLSTMGLSTMGLVDDALGAPAYETGGGLFHAPCPFRRRAGGGPTRRQRGRLHYGRLRRARYRVAARIRGEERRGGLYTRTLDAPNGRPSHGRGK